MSSGKRLINPWDVIDTFFRDTSYYKSQHQIDSFDEFIFSEENGIRNIIKRENPFIIYKGQDPNTVKFDYEIKIYFGETLDENGGMLFIFDSVDNHSFHMTNTTIPLDIAFINREGIIESIKELINSPSPIKWESTLLDTSKNPVPSISNEIWEAFIDSPIICTEEFKRKYIEQYGKVTKSMELNKEGQLYVPTIYVCIPTNKLF